MLDQLLKDILRCKASENCPGLAIRQFFFEPNYFTLSAWQKEGFFLNGMDRRVMFVCESPGPSAVRDVSVGEVRRLFSISDRDKRFSAIRRKYGFENCFVTNAVKCGVRSGEKHLPSEITLCSRFLLREYDYIQPDVVVGVGWNAYQILRDMREYISTKIFRITHFSGRGDVWGSWGSEFPELKQLVGG